MFLSMQNNGKVFSNKYKETQARLSISDKRGTDEERRWTGITKEDGAKLDPEKFRFYPDPPGARYVRKFLVDVRQDPYKHDSSLEMQK